MTTARAVALPGRTGRPGRSERPGRTATPAKVIRLHGRTEQPATKTNVARLLPLLVGLLFLAVIGVVVFQALLVQSQSRLDSLNKRIEQEEAASKALRLQIADAEAPSRIATAAKTRLGMIAPDEVVYLQRRPDDDQRAAYDPAKEPVTPTPTTPTTLTTPTTIKPAPKPTAPTTATTIKPAPKPTTTTTVRSTR